MKILKFCNRLHTISISAAAVLKSFETAYSIEGKCRQFVTEDRCVLNTIVMGYERVKEMMRTYEAYGNRCGRENIARMLEEEDSDSIEKVSKAVGSEALVGQKTSGNLNRFKEEF